MKKVMTMGEIMLRLSAPNHQKVEQAQAFEAKYGGGEANVAVSLAQLGLNSSFVSKVPKNALGKSVTQYLKGLGVGTDHMLYGGERLGIYFLEKGFSLRSSKVIYDRNHSSFSMSELNEYDFDTILSDVDWFHISGITPALNEEMFQLTKRALVVAKQKGITTSCDLNYRSALWTFEAAREKMSELVKHVDVCIGVEPLQLHDANGRDLKDNLPENPEANDYKEIIRKLHEQYEIKYLAMTFRENLSVNCNRLHTLLSDGKDYYQSSKVQVEMVDRVGAGDAFSAGIIYALINEYEPQDAIEFAAACFALKHTIEGDANLLSVSDLEQYIQQRGSFSINR